MNNNPLITMSGGTTNVINATPAGIGNEQTQTAPVLSDEKQL